MKPALPLAATAALLLLAACGDAKEVPVKVTEGQDAVIDHSGHDMSAAGGAGLTEAQAAYKAANDAMHAGMADIPADADVAFMKGMLAHHKGAVAMSEVALKYAKDERARELAARVIAAQSEEIAEMEAWLAARGAL